MKSEIKNEAVPQLSLLAKNGIQAELMIRWTARTGEENLSWVDRYAGDVSPFLEAYPEVRRLIVSGNPEERIHAMEIIEDHLDAAERARLLREDAA